MSQAVVVPDSTPPFSAVADWVTGASGSSLFSVFVSAVDWAGGAGCCVCARLTTLARYKKQIRSTRILIMLLPLSTSLSWFGKSLLLDVRGLEVDFGFKFRPEARSKL
jgi:hypothetical protein